MSWAKSLEIRCEQCEKWFRSPIAFGDDESFDTSTLIGNKAQCSHCGTMTGCNKENMRLRTEDGGFLGIDTMKEVRQQMTLTEIHDKEFGRERVLLDGKHFMGCKFNGSTMEFGATAPVGMIRCGFTDVKWEFTGAASLTINFMTGLYRGAGEGGRELVENTFASIRKGKKV